MTTNFYDFNTATTQTNYDLIPRGTIAKVNIHIKRGGYDDLENGWTGGYTTKNRVTGAIYLDCEFTVLEGKYYRRKIWSLIGLYSDKNNNKWGEIGRSFIRSILNSAKGFSDKDNSEAAQEARKIKDFGELEGLEFITKIDVELDSNGNERNVIKVAVDSSHKDYAKYMSGNNDIPGWA